MESHPLHGDQNFAGIVSGLPCHFYEEIPRDGNCLYTSVARLIYPHLLLETKAAEFFDFVAEFEQAGISSIVYETYIDALTELLAEKRAIEAIKDAEWNHFIWYLRLVVAAHLLNNEE